MKKIMIALFVTMCVVFGSIGMGPKEALADESQLTLNERVSERMLQLDEDRFLDEFERIEVVFERFYVSYGLPGTNVEFIDVHHNGMNSMTGIMVVEYHGNVDTVYIDNVTHEDLEMATSWLNAYVETALLSDWM